MMSRPFQKRVDVSLGEGVVVLKREGQSDSIVAGILGVERNEEGEIVVIWLDRLVHYIGENEFVGWNVSGAVSTVLKRDAPEATSQTAHRA